MINLPLVGIVRLGWLSALSVVVVGTPFLVGDARAADALTPYYENNKPQNSGGLRPSTRKEYMRCLVGWGSIASHLEKDPGSLSYISPDFTLPNAVSLTQHWIKKA